jgi:hypothetical protein
MKHLVILYLKYKIRMAQKSKAKSTNYMVKSAFKNLIESYNSTIIYLKVQK